MLEPDMAVGRKPVGQRLPVHVVLRRQQVCIAVPYRSPLPGGVEPIGARGSVDRGEHALVHGVIGEACCGGTANGGEVALSVVGVCVGAVGAQIACAVIGVACARNLIGRRANAERRLADGRDVTSRRGLAHPVAVAVISPGKVQRTRGRSDSGCLEPLEVVIAVGPRAVYRVCRARQLLSLPGCRVRIERTSCLGQPQTALRPKTS